jgi:low temperature requirement protein LtrA
MLASDDPGRVARDAYTYIHLLIIAGIIATATAEALLIAEPHDSQRGVGAAVLLGGPALFLLGESLFQWKTTGTANLARPWAAALILTLAPLTPEFSTLALSGMVTALLSAVAIWELQAKGPRDRASRQFSAQHNMSRSYL